MKATKYQYLAWEFQSLETLTLFMFEPTNYNLVTIQLFTVQSVGEAVNKPVVSQAVQSCSKPFWSGRHDVS